MLLISHHALPDAAAPLLFLSPAARPFWLLITREANSPVLFPLTRVKVPLCAASALLQACTTQLSILSPSSLFYLKARRFLPTIGLKLFFFFFNPLFVPVLLQLTVVSIAQYAGQSPVIGRISTRRLCLFLETSLLHRELRCRSLSMTFFPFNSLLSLVFEIRVET